jgi:F0F1-type ATP synthase assembly protein I
MFMLEASQVGTVGDHSDRQPKRQTPFLRKAGIYVGVAFELPGTVLGGILVGYLADDYFQTSPWLLIGLTVIAFIGAMMRLIHWVRFFNRETDGDRGK